MLPTALRDLSIQELLSNLTNKIIKEGKFSAKFNDLLRITKKYVKFNAFGKEVDLESLGVRRTLANPKVGNDVQNRELIDFVIQSQLMKSFRSGR